MFALDFKVCKCKHKLLKWEAVIWKLKNDVNQRGLKYVLRFLWAFYLVRIVVGAAKWVFL